MQVHVLGVLVADLAADHARELHDAPKVARGAHAAVVRVARKVVKLVDVDRVAPVGDNLGEPRRERAAAARGRRARGGAAAAAVPARGDQVLDAAQVLGRRRVGVEVVVVHDVVEHLRGHRLVLPAGDAEAAEELALKDVGEGAVAEVVAEARELDDAQVGALNGVSQLRALGGPELVREAAREVRDAERVLEAVVARAGEDVVGRAELLEAAQALELARVEDRGAGGVEAEAAVDRVVHELAVPARRRRRTRGGGGR